MASAAQLIGDTTTLDPLADLPRFSDAAKPKQGSTTANPIGAGISSGFDQLQSMGGAFVAALGDIVGAKGIKDWGIDVAKTNAQEAAAAGRRDLDTPLWEQNLSDLPAWLAYRTSQQVPQMATQLLGGAVLGRAAKGLGMVLPEAAAEWGARAPKIMGGGGVPVGPLTKEALKEGGDFARNLAGATVAGYPMAVGSMYGEAIDRGDPGKGDALAAAALGVPYAALDAMEPVGLMSRLKKGSEGKFVARALSGMISGVALEAPQEAVQTAMEQLFRPDLSASEKFKNIVDAAVTGAAVGGFLGGASGIPSTRNPNAATNDTLKAGIDANLSKTSAGTQAPELQLTGEPQPEQRPFAKQPIEKVQSMLADVEQRTMSGGATQADAQNRALLRKELEARSAEVEAKANPFKDVEGSDLAKAISQYKNTPQEQMTPEIARVGEAALKEQERRRVEAVPVLPGFENLPQQDSPAVAFQKQGERQQIDQQQAAAKENAAIQTDADVKARIAQVGELKTLPPSMKKEKFKSVEEAYGFVKDRLNQGNTSQSILTLGKKLGFLDEDGNDQSPDQIEQKIEANKAKLSTLYQKYADSGKAKQFEVQIAKVQQQNTALTSALEIVRKGEEFAQVRERERNPPTSINPGPARLRGTDGNYQNVQVLEKKPVEVNGKLYQPVRTEKGAEVNVPIASLWEATPTSAPVKEAGPLSPGTQQAEARKTLPMNPREQDATIPPLKTPLFQTTAAAKRAGFVQPRAEVEQSPGSTEYTAGSPAQTFEGIDRAAPGYWQGENVDNRPLEEKIPTLEERDAFDRDFKRYDPLLTEIVKDKSLPRELRRQAAVARDHGRNADIKTGREGYMDLVSEVLSNYSSQTGDMQFMRDRESVFTPEQRAMVKQAITAALQANPKGGLNAVKQALQGDIAAFVANPTQTLEARATADLNGFIDNPDGPFKGATGNVVKSASVEQRYADFLSDLMSMIGFGNIRTFIFHPEDIANGQHADYGLNGPYGSSLQALDKKAAGGIAPFGPGMKDFYIVLKKDMTPERAVETIAHEVGHMVMTVALAKAPASTRAAIRNQYEQWAMKARNMTAQELVRSLRNRYTAGATAANMPANLRATQMPNAEQYWLSENEWFADQVSRWVTTSQKPMTVVEKFFSKIAQMMKMMVRYITGQGFMPATTVKDFMDSMTSSSTPVDWDGIIKFDDATVPQNLIEAFGKVNTKTIHDRLRQTAKAATSTLEKLSGFPVAEASNRLNKMHLYVTTLGHIVKVFGKLFKPGTLEAYYDLHEAQRGLVNRFTHLMAVGNTQYENLLANMPKEAAKLRSIMATTFSDIDPRKKWEDHAHLQEMPNKAVLEKRVKEANAAYRDLSRIVLPDGSRASDIYDTLLASNEMERYANHAVVLYNMVQAEPAFTADFKKNVADPMQAFLSADPTIYEDPAKAREFWKDARDALVKSVGKVIEDANGRLGTLSDTEARKVKKQTDNVANLIRTIGQQDLRMQQAPYFHVGRFGNQIASFRVKADKEGNIDQKMLQDMAQTLEKGNFNFSVPAETVVDHMFFRFETQDEAIRFEEVMKKWEKQGYITRDPRPGEKQGQEPKLAQRGETPITEEPRYALMLIDALKAHFEESSQLDDLSAEQIAERGEIVKQYEATIRQFFQNMLPDSSLTKVNLQRYGVAGFTDDMMRAYAFRANLGAEALAGIYMSPKLSDAIKGITANVNEAKVLGVTDPKTRYTMQNTQFEIMKREADRAIMNRNSFFDMWVALNHNYFLGLSPSYVITQMASLANMLWPKLAGKHGFVQSATAIKDVTPVAFKIIRAAISQAKEGTWKHAFDATITSKVLDAAKVSQSDRAFILRLANDGLFDMGSQSRELGRVIEGHKDSKFEMAMRIASSFGYYSEMLTRLTAALAAKKLHNDKLGDLDKYAHEVVNDSMFQFSNWNRARATGKNGIAGPATPIAFAFMSYTHQLIETLGREIHAGFVAKEVKPERRKEARRFLGAHMAATAMMAGSLGLPAASAFAFAINKMADILGDDDEPYDVVVAYRQWLAATFGQGVGEVLARGLPRAIGFDVSTRVGEQDILPFSRFLSDRRTFGDAFDDYTKNMLGSPVSMIRNIGEGASQLMNGEVVEGARVMSPMALRGLIGAYKLTDKGYVDKKGNAIPLDAGALDIMYQLIGFTPAEKANYDEKYRAYQANRGEMTRLASKYRKDLATAIENNDMEEARSLIADVRRFDEMHPDFAVLPSIGGVLAKRAKERAGAQGGMPLGMKPGLTDQYQW